MQIENPDALRAWLKTYLERQSDAEPVALSKYVIALLKKDKAESELKKSMVEQMDVFLQADTEPFIEALFDTLKTGEYLKGPDLQKAIREIKKETQDPEEAPEEKESENKDQNEVSNANEEANRRSRSGERYKRLESERYDRRRSPRKTGGITRRSPHRRYRSRGNSRSRSRSPTHRNRGRRSPYRARTRSYSPPHKTRRGDSPVADEENPYKRPRCRDYDEKGFCMRGDQCKFDHGNDAVVFDENTPGAAPYNPLFPSGNVPYIPSPLSSSAALPPLHLPPPGYPAAVSLPPAADPTLVPINPRKRPFDAFRGRGAGGAGGFRGRGRGRGTTQLAVRNIPPPLNNIAHLNNHFARFGSLVNVQVQFEGDPASALVSFSNPAEAEQACTSADAVLGNRFIKMFYHYDKACKPDSVAKAKKADDVKPETEEDKAEKEEKKAAEIAAIKKNQEQLEAKAQQKREAAEKRKEQLKQVTDIQNSKQELLGKLIDEEKKLIAMLEEKRMMRPEDRAAIMTMLKDLADKINRAKEELKAAFEQSTISLAGGVPNKHRSLAVLEKELLDAELELFQAQQDGSDTTDIQSKVNLLRQERILLSSGKPPGGGGGGTRGSGRGRGRGSLAHFRGRGPPYYRGGGGGGGGGRYRGRGRGRGGIGYHVSSGATSVDRRPSKILVGGFEAGEKEAVMAHFAKFGDVLDTAEVDDTSLVVHFKTRREAEMAMNGGKQFAEKALDLGWYASSLAAEYTADPASPSAVENQGEGEEATVPVDGDEEEEVDDDYTPLDPTYLPAGLLEDEDQPQEGEDGQVGADEGHKETDEDLLADEEDGGEAAEENVKEEKKDSEELEPYDDDDADVLETSCVEKDELLYQEEDDEEERSWKR